ATGAGRGGSRAGRDRSGGHRGRHPARPVHRPGRAHLHSRRRAAPPPAPAGRQPLGNARRQHLMARPVLLAWSGGKDAAWALHVLRRRGDVAVVGLLSTVTAEHGRASLQGVRREVLQAQAAAAGLPLLEVAIPAACDNATYATVMADALARAAARWPGLRTAAFGDLFLEDIRQWRAQQLARAGWE